MITPTITPIFTFTPDQTAMIGYGYLLLILAILCAGGIAIWLITKYM